MNSDQKEPSTANVVDDDVREVEEEQTNSIENGDEDASLTVETAVPKPVLEGLAPAPTLLDRPSGIGVTAPQAPAVPYHPYQPRARIDGTTYLAAIIAAPFQLAGGVLHGFGAHLSSWIEKKSKATPPQLTSDAAMPQMKREAAKTAVVEAAIASKDVIRDAERFKIEWPAFDRLHADMEAAARPDGKMVVDIVREMKPGGKHEGLWNRFSDMLSADREFAAAHDKLKMGLDRHIASWERAAVAVKAAGGDGNELWAHLDQSMTAIRSATQGIPADAGISFADRIKEMFDKIKDFFCRIFRVAPTVDPAVAPTAHKKL